MKPIHCMKLKDGMILKNAGIYQFIISIGKITQTTTTLISIIKCNLLLLL